MRRSRLNGKQKYIIGKATPPCRLAKPSAGFLREPALGTESYPFSTGNAGSKQINLATHETSAPTSHGQSAPLYKAFLHLIHQLEHFVLFTLEEVDDVLAA